jgi:hypothetical protein
MKNAQKTCSVVQFVVLLFYLYAPQNNIERVLNKIKIVNLVSHGIHHVRHFQCEQPGLLYLQSVIHIFIYTILHHICTNIVLL